MELSKFFDFLEDEKNIYSDWEKSNSFKSKKYRIIFNYDASPKCYR